MITENLNEYDRNSFILYKDSRIFISRLSKSQRGELLLAIFDYACDKIVPNFEYDPMLEMCFELIRAYLDRDEKKYRTRCEKNRENGRKGGLAKARNGRQMLTNASNGRKVLANLADKDKDTDKDTDTVTDSDSDSDTDTETEQANADFDSVERPAGAEAVKTAPPSVDLFSLKQVKASAKGNKVDLTTEGLEIFYKQMQDDDWTLYGKPIKKPYLVRVMHEWAKRHPEFSLTCGEDPEEEEPESWPYI